MQDGGDSNSVAGPSNVEKKLTAKKGKKTPLADAVADKKEKKTYSRKRAATVNSAVKKKKQKNETTSNPYEEILPTLDVSFSAFILVFFKI